MCLAFPGKILKISGETASVDFEGIVKDVNVSLVDAKVDDYIIVHAGFAIQILTEESAMEALKLYKSI